MGKAIVDCEMSKMRIDELLGICRQCKKQQVPENASLWNIVCNNPDNFSDSHELGDCTSVGIKIRISTRFSSRSGDQTYEFYLFVILKRI